MYTLARAHHELGNPTAARELLEHMLQLTIKMSGAPNPSRHDIMHELARVLHQQGAVGGAREMELAAEGEVDHSVGRMVVVRVDGH